jgi:hypothetical protein
MVDVDSDGTVEIVGVGYKERLHLHRIVAFDYNKSLVWMSDKQIEPSCRDEEPSISFYDFDGDGK